MTALDLIEGCATPCISEGHVSLSTTLPVLDAQVSAGPSLVRARGPGGGRDARTLPGLHLGIDVMAGRPRFVGIGVSAYANLNTELPVVGVGLSFSAGRLRR